MEASITPISSEIQCEPASFHYFLTNAAIPTSTFKAVLKTRLFVSTKTGNSEFIEQVRDQDQGMTFYSKTKTTGRHA